MRETEFACAEGVERFTSDVVCVAAGTAFP